MHIIDAALSIGACILPEIQRQQGGGDRHRIILFVYFPKCHPRLIAALACIFANERAFQKAFRAEKKVGFILDRGNDNGTKSYVLARKAIGQELISKHCGFTV